MRNKSKKSRLQLLSKGIQKVLDSRYETKVHILEDRLKEINEKIDRKDALDEDEFANIIRTFEPVMHIHGNCFLVSYFERHTYGVMNFKTREIILPCNYTDISFGKYQDNKGGRFLDATDLFGNVETYLISEKAELYSEHIDEKSKLAKSIARRHNFTPGVNISKASEVI